MCFHFYRAQHFISSKQILQIDIFKRHLDFFKVNCLLSRSSACRFVCFPVTDLDNQRIKKTSLTSLLIEIPRNLGILYFSENIY